MPLPKSSHKLAFLKPKEGFISQKPHSGIFPSAPTINYTKLHLRKQKLLYGRLPPTHSTLQPHQIDWLTYYLSLPSDNLLLTTKIAALGPPLTRHMYSNAPRDLCHVHTWLEVRWIEDLTTAVREEIGPQMEKLRNAPRELLSKPTKKHLKRLEPYRHLFPFADPATGKLPAKEEGGCTKDCKICPTIDISCIACILSHFFQNPKAVRALEILAKGRKKRGGLWSEVCAWLDPKPGLEWEARWKRQAAYVLKDRSKVAKWLKQGGWENTTSERWGWEIDMDREVGKSSVFGDIEEEKPRQGKELPGERAVSFIPSFRELTPSPTGSPYGSPPGSPYKSPPASLYGSISDSSTESTLYDSSWEGEIFDEYALDAKRWCFDENATQEEVLANLKKMGADDDDSDEEVEEGIQVGERKADERAVSYMNMIGNLGLTQSNLVQPQSSDMEVPDWPPRAGEAEDEDNYDWDQEDEEDETIVCDRQADKWAGSYTNLIGNRPLTTQSNLGSRQCNDHRSITDTTPLVGQWQSKLRDHIERGSQK